MIRDSRGLTMKPSAAVRRASSNRLFQGSLPCSPWAMANILTAPRTPVARPLSTAVSKGSGLPVSSRNIVDEAWAGAISRPS